MYRLFIIILTLLLQGCASHQYLDEGRYATVITNQKIAEKDCTPGKGTAVGAGMGLGVGALIGGGIGVCMGTAVTIGTFGLCAPVIPALAAAGAAAGGGVGTLAGGGAGYVLDYNKSGSGTYLYEVSFHHGNKPLVITQFDDEPIPPSTSVCVYLENGNLKISQNLEICKD